MSTNIDRSAFEHLVREALGHLYDHAFLQIHPLSHLLMDQSADEAGITLHRLLVEKIEHLRPVAFVPLTAPAWRPYMALYLRYVEGMNPAQVAEDLTISPRQLRREHLKAVEAIADLLWDEYSTRILPLSTDPSTRRQGNETLDSEIARLGTTAGVAQQRTPLREAIQSAIATLADLAEARQTEVTLHLPEGLLNVWIDRVILRQVLLNVLSHFLDMGSNGQVTVQAQVENEQLTLWISYARGDGSLPPEQEHERLEVVARLVQIQGGKATSYRSDNRRVVELSLPVRQTPTILVIDDNPDILQLFRRFLGHREYQIIGETDATAALRLAREIRPHIILLDVMMPEQDGWEVLQHLHNHPATARMPVIVCSVLQEKALALSLGAAGFLAKPVTQQSLLEALASYKAWPAQRSHQDSL
ncbi:MAG: response regulator [Chloroflexi bacterium]|nr:response regulator [Chloroflexota bacterium]